MWRSVSLSNLLAHIAAWYAHLSPIKRGVLALATTMFVVEVVLRTFAAKSRAYKAWQHGIEAVGSVWTAILLSFVYVLSVGPISACIRLFGKDPLDRAIGDRPSTWHAHEPNPLGAYAAARHQF
jgi:hypothetical protein